MSSMDYPIEINSLVKRYGKGPMVLRGISIKIDKGEIVGYLGPNGSGKTTTIKMLTNLIKPTAGMVKIKGIDVQRYPKKALKHVGALIEVPGIYDYLTPWELLTYFGRVYGMRKKDIEGRIVEVLKEVKLSRSVDDKVGSFSTGMQRRLMIAKSIFHDPEIIILDEPVIGLDPKGIKEVRELVRRFGAQGKSVLMSSHLLSEVSDTCDRVIFLNNGKIVEDDTIERIKEKASIKRIDVSFINHLDDRSIHSINTFKGVARVERKNGGMSIYYDGLPETGRSILKDMITAGFPLYSFTPGSGGLEEFYISIMGDEKGVN
ncbi:MAG: ABC transporter ATP-binding protein [Candidatus Thermoplasmatota archaeon]|nr:ABC transporter ATP-binding protein [Candidatus Thermoplasmatota archaeon]